MKIYIDGLFYKCAGIGRYYEVMLNELLNKGIKIITSIPNKHVESFFRDFGSYQNLDVISVDYEKFSSKGFLVHSVILKKIENKVDIFFFPHINLPKYIPNKSVVTIHDLGPFTEFWDRNIVKKSLFKFYLKRAVEKASKLVCISETTRNDLFSLFPGAKEKSEVIYNFLDEKFLYPICKNYDRLIEEKYILFVGNRKKHKNIEGLIRAYDIIKDKIEHLLVIAGAKEKDRDEVDNLIEKLKIKNRIIEFILPTDKELLNLYSNADLFVFPSFFEGFGFPPLEAVSCGTPAIVSNIPILKEIFGDSAIFFDPYNYIDISEKILMVLNNQDMRKKLLEREKERIYNFDKSVSLKKYLKVFEQIIERKNNA